MAHGPLDLTVANCCLSSLCFFVRLGNFLFFQFKIFPIFSFKVKQSDTWGLYVWFRCDSITDFCHQLDKYLGRDICRPGSCWKADRRLGGENSHVFYHGYFTSVSLAKSLLEKRIFSCGTIIRNRKGFPSDLKNISRMTPGEYFICFVFVVYFVLNLIKFPTVKELKRYLIKSSKCTYCFLKIKFWQDGEMTTTLPNDSRTVAILSTTVHVSPLHFSAFEGWIYCFSFPSIVCRLLQSHFRGLDIFDHFRSKYSVRQPGQSNRVLQSKLNYIRITWVAIEFIP